MNQFSDKKEKKKGSSNIMGNFRPPDFLQKAHEFKVFQSP